MSSSNGESLLQCPFCGCVAQFADREDGGEWVECTGCGVSTMIRFPLKEGVKDHLIEAWNRRVAVEPPAPASNQCACPNGSYGKKHTPECYEAQIERLRIRIRTLVDDNNAVRHERDLLKARSPVETSADWRVREREAFRLLNAATYFVPVGRMLVQEIQAWMHSAPPGIHAEDAKGVLDELVYASEAVGGYDLPEKTSCPECGGFGKIEVAIDGYVTCPSCGYPEKTPDTIRNMVEANLRNGPAMQDPVLGKAIAGADFIDGSPGKTTGDQS